MLPKYCCSLLVGRRARRAGDDGVLERCSRLALRWRERSGRACACGLAAVLLVMGGAQRAQSTMGVSSLLDSAARRAVAFALRCCCKHVSAKSCQSSRASLCSDVLVSCVCRGVHEHTSQSKLASKPRVPNDPSHQSRAERGPSRLVTGSVASSHLSLCEPAPSLRYRLSQCSAAAAVIFLHGKASSSADLLRCSHYTEA